jgi:flagellar motor protein MotB
VSDPDKVQEIIIIKRSGEGEQGHHGGAWKIAFADFMTAMMALFLVLWLINAANEETKKAVASYFNPVKLVDKNRSVKGLHDAEGVQEIEVQAPNEQFPEQESDAPTEAKPRPTRSFSPIPSPRLTRSSPTRRRAKEHRGRGRPQRQSGDQRRPGRRSLHGSLLAEFLERGSPPFKRSRPACRPVRYDRRIRGARRCCGSG